MTIEVATTTKTDIKTSYQVATIIAARLPHYKNSTLSELRRMSMPFRSPRFEMLCEEFSEVTKGNEREWQSIIQIMAILSNNKPKASSIHDPEQRLGKALANGGHKQAVGKKTFLTEMRFGKLMRVPHDQRGEALVRITRVMSQNFGLSGRVNVGSIADFILSPNDIQNRRRLVTDYHNTAYFMANPKT